MRVWPETAASEPSLSGSEGALISVSISVYPRRLESLLEALAQIGFPVNPQIYHDASVVYRFADGRQEVESTTLVEFPAYAGRLNEVCRALEINGFDSACVGVTSMLDEIHDAPPLEEAPAGAKWISRYRLKQRAAVV